MTLRNAILARLEAIGWNQSDLSRAANIPRQNLSAMLTGRRPILAGHVLVIDSVLGLGLDYSAAFWPEPISTPKSA